MHPETTFQLPEDGQPRFPEERPGPVRVPNQRILELEPHALEERGDQFKIRPQPLEVPAAAPHSGSGRIGGRFDQDIALSGSAPTDDHAIAIPTVKDDFGAVGEQMRRDAAEFGFVDAHDFVTAVDQLEGRAAGIPGARISSSPVDLLRSEVSSPWSSLPRACAFR
jgi:hypothetical protein